MSRYLARTASDKDPNWPIWYVADGGPSGLNVTNKLFHLVGIVSRGAVLTDKPTALEIARIANEQQVDWRQVSA